MTEIFNLVFILQHSKALDSTLLELTKNLNILQDTEKSACRKALIEQRSRYCIFVTALRPVLDEESGMVTDFQQLEEINKKLSKCTDEPYQLPPATEQMINDMKADGFTFQTPPSSPSSLGIQLPRYYNRQNICLLYLDSL